MKFEDFIDSTYSSFEVKIDIWKKEADIFLNIPETMDKNLFLKNHLDIINDEILLRIIKIKLKK